MCSCLRLFGYFKTKAEDYLDTQWVQWPLPHSSMQPADTAQLPAALSLALRVKNIQVCSIQVFKLDKSFTKSSSSQSPRLSVELKRAHKVGEQIEEGGRRGVLAGPNVFIASMKRPETPIKSNKHTKKATGRRSERPLCASCVASLPFFLFL